MGKIVNADFFDNSPTPDSSLSTKVAGTLASAGQGGFGNFIDEATAGISSVPSYLGALSSGNSENLSLGDIYDEQLGNVRQGFKSFEKSDPVLSTGSKIGGAILSPINKIKVAKGILGLATSGGIQGSIQGFGGGEGDTLSRLENSAKEAIDSALFSGGAGFVGKGLKKVAKGFSSLGDATKNNAYGIYATDIKKSLEKGVRATGDTTAPIVKSLDRLIKSGDIVAGDATENLARLEGQLGDFSDDIKTVLKKADNVQQNLIEPDYARTLKYIDNLDNTDKKKATEQLKELIKNEADNNLFISDWEKSKSALGKAGSKTLGLGGGDEIAPNLKKYMAYDIKNAIDNELKSTHYKSALGDDVYHQVKNARQALADRLTVLPSVVKGAAREATDTPVNKILKSIATTGGYGVPALMTGSLPLAVGIGLAANTGIGKRTIAAGLKGVSSLSDVSGQGLEDSALALGRISGALELEGNKKNAVKSPTAKRIVDSSFFSQEPVNQQKEESEPLALNATKAPSKVSDQLLDAVRQVESGGGKYLVSNKGALGPYQIMPDVGKTLIKRRFGVNLKGTDLEKALMDEATSRLLAGDLMKENLERFGDTDKAIAAYNAGAPAVAKYDGTPPYKETKDYVKKVNLAFNRLLTENA